MTCKKWPVVIHFVHTFKYLYMQQVPLLDAGDYKTPQGPWTHRAHMIEEGQT